MKLSCKVIEDMLPMYYDGICSDESAALIEEHLKECLQCTRMLSNLHADIEIADKPTDDLKPLKNIQRKWKNSNRLFLRRGICITLAALVLLFTVVSGIWYFSYGKYYYPLIKIMERTSDADKFFTSSDYSVEQGGYRYEVWLPVVLSNSGFVRVMAEDDLTLFLYPETGGTYSFWLYIADHNNEAYAVHLKADMTPDFENHQFPVRNDTEKQQITQLLIDRHDEVTGILDAVKSLWGIDLLKYL